MTCVEKRGIFWGGVVVCSLGEESWDEEEEREIGGERIGRVVIYSLFTDGITDRLIMFVIPSAILTVN